MSTWLKWRWVLDRGIALLLLGPIGPLIVVLGAAVRMHDRGPAFVRLDRIGQGGRAFRMWKLRTMRAAGPAGHAGGSPLTISDDPRVTRLGRWLRNSRLDELPQLANVISGEMALIGPRPETPAYVDPLDPQWQVALLAKPGIAGPTQLLLHEYEAKHLREDNAASLYGGTILPAKLAVDRWYIENASPYVDLLIAISLAQRFLLQARVTTLHRHLSNRARRSNAADPLRDVSKLLQLDVHGDREAQAQ